MNDLTPLASAADDPEPQRGRPFEPGTSGNPKGRPKGSRNKATLVIEALLEGESDAIVRKVIDKAKEGDPAMLRLCLERLLPLRRDRPVAFDMPEINSPADLVKASTAVMAACADGTLSPDEAAKIMELITGHGRTLELAEFEERLKAVEKERQK